MCPFTPFPEAMVPWGPLGSPGVKDLCWGPGAGSGCVPAVLGRESGKDCRVA